MFCEDKLDYKEWNTEKGKLLLNDDLKSQIYTTTPWFYKVLVVTVKKGRDHSAQKEQGRGPEGCHLWPREETKDTRCQRKKSCRSERKSLAWQYEFQPFKQFYFPTLWWIIQIPVLTPVQQQAQSGLFRSFVHACKCKGADWSEL